MSIAARQLPCDFLHSDTVRESERFGVTASLGGVDVAQVNAYKDGVVARLHKGLTGLVSSRPPNRAPSNLVSASVFSRACC